MAPRRPPLLSFNFQDTPTPGNVYTNDSDAEAPRKRWFHYLPLAATILLILAPHPSLLLVLIRFHYQTLGDTFQALRHAFVLYGSTALAFSSLIVCVARNPGPVPSLARDEDGEGEEQMGLTEALDDDFTIPGRWCRKCWAPKPERAHHCSFCGQCVLKMDHHCPWLGQTCIGHRTYPAFVHFLTSIVIYAAYVAYMNIHVVLYAFRHPAEFDNERMVNAPVHAMFLSFTGLVFGFVIGSFWIYHLYLITTNQTTIEAITPFLLLKHLPPLPYPNPASPSRLHNLSDPPLEPELSFPQRRLVKDAHASVHLYDIGWKKNWAQAFGVVDPKGPGHGRGGKWAWAERILRGGSSPGDGRTFPRNPRAEEMLARLAREIVGIDKDS
ncbi:DHHC palmitoyltransferase-domain-containing protein [Flagelloscypha sp. PMI_526]|nr:DHHC palmitoyltransferase-domain-containing protein [Flagelloscypha sp. PMI_526]